MSRTLTGGEEFGLDLAATNLSTGNGRLHPGRQTRYRDEDDRKVESESRSVSAMPMPSDSRGAIARNFDGRVDLHVRPYARHSRMDFMQHFLVGKPLEENGQESLGVVSTSFDITAFTDTHLLAGIDLETRTGILQGDAARSGNGRRAGRERNSSCGQALRL